MRIIPHMHTSCDTSSTDDPRGPPPDRHLEHGEENLLSSVSGQKLLPNDKKDMIKNQKSANPNRETIDTRGGSCSNQV